MKSDLEKILAQQEYIQRLIDPYGSLRNQHLLTAADQVASLHGRNIGDMWTPESIRLFAGLTEIHRGSLSDVVGLYTSPVRTAADELIGSLGLDPRLSGNDQLITTLTAANGAYESQFRLPELSEVSNLARSAIEKYSIAGSIFGKDLYLQESLAGMAQPWLHQLHESASVGAMARLIAIGQGIERFPVYDEGFAQELRKNLGDWRDATTPPMEVMVDPVKRTQMYIDRGFDRELTDFTSLAFDEGLQAAGLTDDEDEDGSSGDDVVLRSTVAFEQLTRFERAVRHFIVVVMVQAFGDDWIQKRVPAATVDIWTDKQQKAIKAGQPEHPLIDYADFGEYLQIIERKDNWREVFCHSFKRQEDVRESFQRLAPVRNATMHSRIITLDDHLMLKVETRRVLRAIGHL